MELSDRRIFEWWNGGVVDLSNYRMLQWWVGGVGGVIQSSSRRIVGKWLVKLSNHRMVRW